VQRVYNVNTNTYRPRSYVARFLYVFGRPGLGAASAISPTISSTLQTRSVSPAARQYLLPSFFAQLADARAVSALRIWCRNVSATALGSSDCVMGRPTTM